MKRDGLVYRRNPAYRFRYDGNCDVVFVKRGKKLEKDVNVTLTASNMGYGPQRVRGGKIYQTLFLAHDGRVYTHTARVR